MVYFQVFYTFFEKYPLAFVELFSGMILFGYTVYKYKKLLNYFFPFIIYSTTVLIYELLGNYFAVHNWNNHLIFLWFYLIESLVFILYFLKINQFKSQKFSIIGILFLTISIIFYDIVDGNNLMNNFSGTIQSIGFIIISLFCYYGTLEIVDSGTLISKPVFWINTAVFVYFAGKFFVFIFITKVLDPSDSRLSDFWNIITLMLVIFRILLCIGISQIKDNSLNEPKY